MSRVSWPRLGSEDLRSSPTSVSRHSGPVGAWPWDRPAEREPVGWRLAQLSGSAVWLIGWLARNRCDEGGTGVVLIVAGANGTWAKLKAFCQW